MTANKVKCDYVPTAMPGIYICHQTHADGTERYSYHRGSSSEPQQNDPYIIGPAGFSVAEKKTTGKWVIAAYGVADWNEMPETRGDYVMFIAELYPSGALAHYRQYWGDYQYGTNSEKHISSHKGDMLLASMIDETASPHTPFMQVLSRAELKNYFEDNLEQIRPNAGAWPWPLLKPLARDVVEAFPRYAI